MKRALLCGGGAAKGAVQVYPVEQLISRHGLDSYGAMLGVSTGSLTTAMAAQGKLDRLRAMYDEVKGTRYFMRPNIEHVKRGLNTLKPLRKKLRREVKLADMKVPYGCGIYDLEDDCYRTIWSDTRTGDEDLYNAILASCAEPLIMDWWRVRVDDGAQHVCMDGGLRNVIPDLPDWHKYEAIDVVMCQPLDRSNPRPQKDVNGLLEVAGRSVEVWIDGVVGRDLERLKSYAAAGVDVTIYAPKNAGKSLDASRETIQWRMNEVGVEMWRNPTHLTRA